MAEVNLLRSLPQSKRNVEMRADGKDPEVVRISREYGEMYFDGPRDYGYGGYRYDGRWVPVATDIINHFSLKPGDRLLDVGCAKGFLVKDLVDQGIDAIGVDISNYALENAMPEVRDRLQIASAEKLPFDDDSFACVLSLNTVHNLKRPLCVQAMQEIQRLSGGQAFVQVDSYKTPEQKRIFESWVLTAEFHDYPEGWVKLFDEAGYTGDYYWTIIN